MATILHVYIEFRAELMSLHSYVPIRYLANMDLIGFDTSSTYHAQTLMASSLFSWRALGNLAVITILSVNDDIACIRSQNVFSLWLTLGNKQVRMLLFCLSL